LFLFLSPKLLLNIFQRLLHSLILIAINNIIDNLGHNLITRLNHLLNNIIIFQYKIPSSQFNITMVDNPIDILNHIFQSVIVFMSEGNLCLLLDVGLKKL